MVVICIEELLIYLIERKYVVTILTLRAVWCKLWNYTALSIIIIISPRIFRQSYTTIIVSVKCIYPYNWCNEMLPALEIDNT